MHVVVVGGGIAGVGVATSLAKSRPSNVPVEITLVDPKTYFEIRWAALRAFYDEKIRKQMDVPYDSFLSKYSINHVQAKAASLSKTSLRLDNGSDLKFDICVVTVGAACHMEGLDATSPDISERHSFLASKGEALVNKNLLVVGGGAVGVEVAGEVALQAKSASKKVTMIHASDRLVPEIRPNGSRVTLRKLQGMGVEVMLNERAEHSDGTWTAKSSGAELSADAVLDCRGYKPVNDFFKTGDLPGALDKHGWIKVDDHFRVEGAEGRIFAMGDCSNQVKKTGTYAMANIPVVVANVKATLQTMANNKSASDIHSGLKTKRPGPPMMILTLGSKAGIADTPLGVMTAVLPALKNSTMFIGRARGMCGAK